MKARFVAIVARIDALTTRERAIAFAVTIGMVWLTWDFALFGPLDARRDALQADVERVSAEVGRMHQQISEIALTRAVDPDVSTRRRLETLDAALQIADAALVEATRQLVPPQEMSAVLEAVLDRGVRLRLVRLEGLGVVPVLAVDPALKSGEAAALQDTNAAPPPAALYRHGLRLVLEGTYLDTLRYLRQLESLSWRFRWDSVIFEVIEYPRARVSITVHSLSLDERWIGA